METKSTEQEAARGETVKEACHLLHVVPVVRPSTTSMSADTSLRELLESFKPPHQDQQQSHDDDDNLPSAA